MGGEQMKHLEFSADEGAEAQLLEHLREEHRRLEHILRDVRDLAARGSYVSAAKRFGEFRSHQERHLQAEQHLLELLDASPRCVEGVAALRRDPEDILGALAELWTLLTEWRVEAVPEKLDALHQLLSSHERREAEVLFPELGATLGDP